MQLMMKNWLPKLRKKSLDKNKSNWLNTKDRWIFLLKNSENMKSNCAFRSSKKLKKQSNSGD